MRSNRPPRSPFAMSLSGSAKEVEFRIRTIVQGPKKRPPIWLLALVFCSILSCGWLVSCQPRQAGPEIMMETQYYDIHQNCIEIPRLALPSGQQETEGIAAINRALDDLEAEYEPLLTALENETADLDSGDSYENRCVLYPTVTDRYINLLFYRQNFTTDRNTGHFLSLVYDMEEERMVTLEDALQLADTLPQDLYTDLAAQVEGALAQNHPGWDLQLQNRTLDAFRMGQDGKPIFYLTARTDDRDDSIQDMVSGAEHVYIREDGVFVRWEQYMVDGPLPVPEKELTAMDPPLYWQWYGKAQPEGGYVDPATGGTQAAQLAKLAMEDWEYLYDARLSVPLRHTQSSRTLMLVEATGTPHAAGLDNLILGIWDSRGQEFVGEPFRLRGDDGQFTSWEDMDGTLYLLCANSSTFQGDESFNELAYFQFIDGELTRLYQLPAAALGGTLDPGSQEARAMLYPRRGDAEANQLSDRFWTSHKAVPSGAGFELYEVSENWEPVGAGSASQWSFAGYVPFADPRAAGPAPAEARRMILDYYRREYPMYRAYLDTDQPAQPQEGDLRIGSVTYMGAIRMDEIYAAAYRFTLDSYSLIRQSAGDPGTMQWYAGNPEYIVLSVSGYDGALQRVLGTDVVTEGKPVEDAIREIVDHLMDADVCLYRDGWPSPVGPGNCPDLFNPAYEAETVEVLDGWEPVYNDGDYWDRWSVKGFTALRYYIAAENRWSSYTIDVTRTDFSTPRNIRVGSSRAEVLEAYPDLFHTPYWHESAEDFPRGDYLWYCDNEDGWGAAILFFFEGDTVRQIRLNSMFD